MHPLRNIARELNAIPAKELVGHQLALPRLHQDDEIGMLVRSYNLNQQLLQRHYEEQNENAMRFPVSDLPNKALLMEMLEQVVARKQTTALMMITCETLRDTAGVLKEAQREILLLTLVEKLKSVLSPRKILAQISGYDFAVIANGVQEPWHAITLGQQVLTIMSERLPIERIQLVRTVALAWRCSTAISPPNSFTVALFLRHLPLAIKARIRFSSLIRSRWKPPRSG
ncbi:putative diguanylate cyclase [Escherichia coli]|uniref:Putative diguanylate cyclase n=1 Tax=Escherichia coli TaxID=562 RepID=A0A377ALN5_ECOLX|nr:putative diguanylate cyclase [Escherichia coli]